MKKEILSILRCPSCQSGEENLKLVDFKEKKKEIFSGFLQCRNGHKFKIKNYIADLCDEFDVIVEDSYIYDMIWDEHPSIYYPGKIEVYKKKFNEFSKLPGKFEQYFGNKLILDIGCGEGRFTYLASEMQASHVVSIDYSTIALNRALIQTKNPKNVSFIRCNLLKMPFKKETFDYIFSFGVLHHTNNTHNSFKSIIRYLKKKGYVSIYVYGKNSLPLIQWWLRPITLKISKEKIARFCHFFGFSYNNKIKPKKPIDLISKLLRRLVKFDILGIGNITIEGLTTKFLWEHSQEEVSNWFKELGLKIISSTKGVSMSGRKEY